MNKKQDPRAQLFFVCPCCQLEHFLRARVGNVFFATAPAAIFNLDDRQFVDSLYRILRHNNIRQLVAACDTGCTLLRRTLAGERPGGLPCDDVLEFLACRDDSPYSLAERIARYGMHRLQQVLARTGRSNDYIVKAMVTDGKSNRIKWLPEPGTGRIAASPASQSTINPQVHWLIKSQAEL